MVPRCEAVELRILRTAGLGVPEAPAALRDLGVLTLDAARAGVEVTATIPPAEAVTFRFTVAVPGDYTLRVRYEGSGLRLGALGLGGAAEIDAGPSGPFEVISLPLEAAVYSITATAAGRQPVFVDWELIADPGIGQGPAQGVTLLASAPSLAAAQPPGGASTSSQAPAGPVTPAYAPPLMLGMEGQPVGKTDAGSAHVNIVGTGLQEGGADLALAGNAFPVGLGRAALPGDAVPTLALGEEEDQTDGRIVEILPIAADAPAVMPEPGAAWLGRQDLVQALRPESGPSPEGDEPAQDEPRPEENEPVKPDAAFLAMPLGLVTVACIQLRQVPAHARRWFGKARPPIGGSPDRPRR